jgi:FkbM family methyltransferase
LRSFFSHHVFSDADRWERIEDFDGDLKLNVDRCSYLGSSLYWLGYSQLNVPRFLKKALHEDSVFIDVGANQGEFSVLACKYLPQGKVIAFEPHPAMYKALVDNLQLNQFNNYQTFNFGLYEEEGELNLYTSTSTEVEGAWNEGLFSGFKSSERDVLSETVPVHTLDTVINSLSLDKLDVIKVDIEGSELPVLRGAKDCLQRFHPDLIIEINEETFKAAGYRAIDLVNFLKAQGYSEQFRINRNGQLLKEDLLSSGRVCFDALFRAPKKPH